MANLPVPSPRTFAPGEVEAAGYLDSQRDALIFLLNKPIGTFSQNAVQSIANTTWTAISLDLTTVDSYGGHSNVTNNTRYTAIVAGWYLCCGTVSFAVSATGNRGAALAVNGTRVMGGGAFGGSIASNSPTLTTPARLLFLNAGDYVEVHGYQTSGGALNTASSSDLDSGLTVTWDHA